MATRTYLAFGSDDGTEWELLGRFEAGGSQQALTLAHKAQQYRHYGVTPERNWSQGSPNVRTREPVVDWEMSSSKAPRAKPLPGQQTVDEALAEKDDETAKSVGEAVAAARGALED